MNNEQIEELLTKITVDEAKGFSTEYSFDQAMDGYAAIQIIRQLLAQVKELQRNRCDHCGAKTIDRCHRCGAPQCCPQCCTIDDLQAQLSRTQKAGEALAEAVQRSSKCISWADLDGPVPNICRDALQNWNALQKIKGEQK